MTIEDNLAYFMKNGKLNVSARQRKEMLSMLDNELKRRKEQAERDLRNQPYPTDDDLEGLEDDVESDVERGFKYGVDNDIEHNFKRGLKHDFKRATQLRKELSVEIETEQRQQKIKQLEEKIENLKREHFANHTTDKVPGKLWPGKSFVGLPLNLIFAMLIVTVGIVKFIATSSDAAKLTTEHKASTAKAQRPSLQQSLSQSQQQSLHVTTDSEREALLSLDQRRVELEARSQGLDKKEMELSVQDRIVTEKIAELKSVYGQLQARRQEIDHKREAKLEQLAEVYSTMAPEQAAPIIAKLDNDTALSLLQRMSGKRMGQILSSMNSDRAIELTKGLRG